MQCWQCGSKIEVHLGGKTPFRAECDKCSASLHSCLACKFYKPGMKNDCMVPDTEYVSDRKAMNLCEEFKAHGLYLAPQAKPSKNKFDDLFK